MNFLILKFTTWKDYHVWYITFHTFRQGRSCNGACNSSICISYFGAFIDGSISTSSLLILTSRSTRRIFTSCLTWSYILPRTVWLRNCLSWHNTNKRFSLKFKLTSFNSLLSDRIEFTLQLTCQVTVEFKSKSVIS